MEIGYKVNVLSLISALFGTKCSKSVTRFTIWIMAIPWARSFKDAAKIPREAWSRWSNGLSNIIKSGFWLMQYFKNSFLRSPDEKVLNCLCKSGEASTESYWYSFLINFSMAMSETRITFWLLKTDNSSFD